MYLTRLRSLCLLAIFVPLILGAWRMTSAAEKKQNTQQHGPIAWMDSLEKARKIGAREKKPILVDFYAEWCGPCQEMLRTTYKDKQVVERSKRFVSVLIDVDKQTKLAEKYGIQSIPTVLFLNAKGDVLRQEVGYHDSKQFLQITDEVLKNSSSSNRQAAH